MDRWWESRGDLYSFGPYKQDKHHMFFNIITFQIAGFWVKHIVGPGLLLGTFDYHELTSTITITNSTCISVFGSPSGQPPLPAHLMFVHLFHDGDILFGWKHLGVRNGPWYLILDFKQSGNRKTYFKQPEQNSKRHRKRWGHCLSFDSLGRNLMWSWLARESINPKYNGKENHRNNFKPFPQYH